MDFQFNPSKTSSKAAAPWLTLAIVLLALGGGVWYVIAHQSKENGNTLNTNQHPDWASYTNSDFGFGFQYPGTWDTQYYTDPVRKSYYEDALVAARTVFTNSQGGQDYGELVVYAFRISNHSDLAEWVDAERPVGDGTTVQTTGRETVNGFPALKRVATNIVAGGYLVSTFIQLDEAIIEFQTNSRILQTATTNQQEFDAAANEIIHTLRKMAWDRYRNPTYGYTFRYPAPWRIAQNYMTEYAAVRDPKEPSIDAFVALTTLGVSDEASFVANAKTNPRIASRLWLDFALGKSIVIQPLAMTVAQYTQDTRDTVITSSSNVREVTLASGIHITRLERSVSDDNGAFTYDVALFPIKTHGMSLLEVRIETNHGNYEQDLFETILNTFNVASVRQSYNNERGFSVLYPDDWSVVPWPNANIVAQFVPRGATYYDEGAIAYPIYLAVQDETVAQHTADVDPQRLSTVTVGTNVFTRLEPSGTGSVISYLVDLPQGSLSINDHISGIAHLNALTAEQAESMRAVFNDLLESLRIQGSALYSNAEYGYSFQYPI